MERDLALKKQQEAADRAKREAAAAADQVGGSGRDGDSGGAKRWICKGIVVKVRQERSGGQSVLPCRRYSGDLSAVSSVPRAQRFPVLACCNPCCRSAPER